MKKPSHSVRFLIALVWCSILASCGVALLKKPATPAHVVPHAVPIAHHGRKKTGGCPGSPPNPPDAPVYMLDLNVNRRATSFALYWPAPQDGCGNAVAGYQIRVARVPITSGNFDDPTVVCGVQYGLTPVTPGTPVCN